jgi:hypothetical protein
MKLLVAVAGLAGILLVSSGGVAAAQTTYPLVCRGTTDSNAMKFELWQVSNTYNVRITFQKGTAGFWAAPLQPGQCTWLDRGIRGYEPNTVYQAVTYPYWDGGLTISGGTLSFLTGANAAQQIPYFPLRITGTIVSSQTPLPGTLFDPGTYYTFNAYNDGTQFVIASVRCAGVCG